MDITRIYARSGHGSAVTPCIAQILKLESVYPNSTVDAERIVSTIKRLLDPVIGTEFLDVGAGYGFFSKRAILAGFNVTALELAENESKIFRELVGKTPIKSTFEDYSSKEGTFSAILMSQVLEHASDFNFWIAKSRLLLKPGGILAVAVPNYNSLFRYLLGVREPHICPPEHVNFFTVKSLGALLKKNGFSVCDIHTVSRLNPVSVSRRLHAGKLGDILFPPIVYRFTRLLDWINAGMYLNVYAKRTN